MLWLAATATTYVLTVGLCISMAWAVSEQDAVMALVFGGLGIAVTVIWLAFEDRIGGRHDDQS